jgi:hypothetical protein
LIAVVFSMLGRGKLGWAYVIPIIVILAGVRQFQPALAALALPIYIGAWVHANLLLSRYQADAQERIAAIDGGAAPGPDGALEKGILLHKVLGQKDQAVEVLARAQGVEGADPVLLNLAGAALCGSKRFPEAGRLFDAARPRAKDPALITQIERNQALVAKKTA